jgi:glycosyltransferase involved in cell wall biosynthesis
VTGPRLLVCAAAAYPVLGDLADGLQALGWGVDRFRVPPTPASGRERLGGVLAGLAGGPGGPAWRVGRRALREVRTAASASTWFPALEERLRDGGYHAVVACVDQAPIGLARLVVRCHPRAVIVSLVSLGQELRFRHVLPVLRAAARVGSRRPLQRDVLRAVAPDALGPVVFPTAFWKRQGIAAGVPSERAHVIPLGVSAGDWEGRIPPLGTPARLLWAGRLSPEKGLHFYLDALPRVAAERPVTLTAIAAPGPADYARRIARRLERPPLDTLVRLVPGLPRLELLVEFTRHDALLFHSVFGEPVAQVMLHAAVAGLPVVGPASPEAIGLLRDPGTAWCYRDTSPDAVADAVSRALGDDVSRTERARALRDEVRRDHDIALTIARYDTLLRSVAGLTPARERVP